MGACTVTVVDQGVSGSKRVVLGRIACSASYAAGGDTFTAAKLGLVTIDKMFVLPSALVTSTIQVPAVVPTGGSWPATGGKLAMFGDSGGAAGSALAEASGDLSGFTCEFMAWGA
jgi:hypothetical protein